MNLGAAHLAAGDPVKRLLLWHSDAGGPQARPARGCLGSSTT